jgi:predicted kinase
MVGCRFGSQRRTARFRFIPTDCGFQPLIGRLPQMSQTRAKGSTPLTNEPAHHPLGDAGTTPILARYDRPMQSGAPTLVIISGAPGSGKTTLARRLAFDLRLPLLVRDELKETLADAMGMPTDLAASARLGSGAYAALYLVTRRLLEAGNGAVIESNFRRGVSEVELETLVARADASLIHCTAADSVIEGRYLARHGRGERHAAHLDAQRATALTADLASGTFDPLELAIPTLVVDTTDGWRPTYDEIRDFAAVPRAVRT